MLLLIRVLAKLLQTHASCVASISLPSSACLQGLRIDWEANVAVSCSWDSFVHLYEFQPALTCIQASLFWCVSVGLSLSVCVCVCVCVCECAPRLLPHANQDLRSAKLIHKFVGHNANCIWLQLLVNPRGFSVGQEIAFAVGKV